MEGNPETNGGGIGGWMVAHWAIISTILAVTATATSAAFSVQQRISNHSDKIVEQGTRIDQLGARVAEDHDRLNEALGDLKHIRREIDRSNQILDRIDKRMP